jgi:hypothetical protein
MVSLPQSRWFFSGVIETGFQDRADERPQFVLAVDQQIHLAMNEHHAVYDIALFHKLLERSPHSVFVGEIHGFIHILYENRYGYSESKPTWPAARLTVGVKTNDSFPKI